MNFNTCIIYTVFASEWIRYERGVCWWMIKRIICRQHTPFKSCCLATIIGHKTRVPSISRNAQVTSIKFSSNFIHLVWADDAPMHTACQTEFIFWYQQNDALFMWLYISQSIWSDRIENAMSFERSFVIDVLWGRPSRCSVWMSYHFLVRVCSC